MSEIEGVGAGPAPAGPAVLDIGVGAGALLVRVPAALLGHEIEVMPPRGSGPRVHTGVHERAAGDATIVAALFASLAPGDYTLLSAAGRPDTRVVIAEGRVTELDWR